MATQPILYGVTLAHPSEFEISEVLAGSAREVADGTIAIDIVDPYSQGAYRKVFKLSWATITNTEANTIETQYWGMVGVGYATFTAPDGTFHTVEPLKDVKLERKAVKMAGGTLRYNVVMELKNGA